MDIKFICTYWGSENMSAKDFLHKVLENGFDGVEINFPDNHLFINEFIAELNIIRNSINPNFMFIAQQVLSNQNETVDSYKERLLHRLRFLTDLNPDAINSHTGKDHYDFDTNVNIVSLTEEISQKTGIPIWHEIHRGRFTFHLKSLIDYLKVFPNLILVADLSHFCVVSESDLSDQLELLAKIYPNIQHIHARVGNEQSPQINHPFAPEWEKYLSRYLNWWTEIIHIQSKNEIELLTITPEFGPFPYMNNDFMTKRPVVNQWELNLRMKNYLQSNLSS